MRKICLILLLIFFLTNSVFADEVDYRQIYMDLELPSFSYVHGIDPGQYYDNQYATYSIYPLFRLCSPLYFKTITIMPGYYDLTPRNYKGNDYLLFKSNGVVQYIIPVYKREIVPEGFYESHLPQQRLNWQKKMSKKFYGFIGKHIKSAKRKPPVKTYLEVNDLDNNFLSIVVYFNNYRYYTIFRTVQM
jgi:hypothetical protein